MYTATVTEALADMIVVIGTLHVGFVPVLVLFDYGCTHFFISYAHIDRIGGQIENLGHSLLVSTHAGGVVATSKCVRRVTIEIQ